MGLLRRGTLPMLLVSALSLAACSGGSDAPAQGSETETVNTAPTANAGPDQVVGPGAVVDLNGTLSSDFDRDALSFLWTQIAGDSVVLSDLTDSRPSFSAPAVAANDVVTLSFQLTVSDGSASDADTVDITVQGGQTSSLVRVSGVLGYEWVPTQHDNRDCFGLDFAATTKRPIRAATVQLMGAGNTVLASTVAGDDGSYAFDGVPGNSSLRIRVRAELKQSGMPGWDVEVRDNVDTSANPPALRNRPLYVVEWPLQTGSTDLDDADFTARTGWGGSSYTGTRAAAPFAILDTIYSGMQFVLAEDPAADFPPLDVFWSINNTRTDGSPTDVDIGELGGSFYIGGQNDRLFIMGDADVDTGEFDYYVTLHEWGHYIEDNFSRSDSVGGTHYIGGLVEARVSFGEGWGTGFGAMASGSPMACNTGAADGRGSWGFNVETFNRGHQGWYNELSVATILLDLYDNNDDRADTGSIGFGPIYEVMTNGQKDTAAFTTLFSFATLLRENLDPAGQALLDALLDAENIETAGLDIWAGSQAGVDRFPNNARDIMPLYVDYAANGSTLTNICVNNDLDPDGDGNKPAGYRYLRIPIATAAEYEVSVVTNPPPPPSSDPPDPNDPSLPNDRSDPDIYIYLNGDIVAAGAGIAEDVETLTTQRLSPGVYVADLHDWRFEDEDVSSDYPDRTCFDVTMTPR